MERENNARSTSDVPLELWGGPECALVRVGDELRDEVGETGHRDREGDLERIADLGIRTLRYPILWEACAADPDGPFDFSWHDRQLGRLRELGIEVIAGLLHHGSGPTGTGLLDPRFPERLARFAAAVAKRYPWIERWTPINEPLTTARFALLYGHWSPHKQDHAAFTFGVGNQCLAIAAAMRAIREHVPAARLVQTEDIAKAYSTPELADQAEYENRRRWLSLDLLFGRVDEKHGWFDKLVAAGITPAQLAILREGDGRPQLIGVDYYLTSERFLDQRIERYPGLPVGGNDKHRYVDAEAVRVPELAGEVGLKPRLHEVWDRYSTPLAITEIHHGCTRDEQLRWFDEAWRAAHQARTEGIDVRAATLWALFGATDWRSLLTRRENAYEVGAFDVRSTPPRATAIARAATAYAVGAKFDHPVLGAPGWWSRPQRFYEPHDCKAGEETGHKLLIVGAGGTLGRGFAEVCGHRGLAYHATHRTELDLTDSDSIRRAMEVHQPWAIVNAAGFVRVADAEREADICFAANRDGAAALAAIASEHAVPLASFSTDLVFDGASGPYAESAPCSPTGVYGASKCAAEEAILGVLGEQLVVRTAAFFGPWDVQNFAWRTLADLAARRPVSAPSDVMVSPTYVPDLCHAVLDLLIDGERGVWHLANADRLSWFEFARRLAERAELDPCRIRPTSEGPRDTSLVSERGQLLRPLDEAIDDFVRAWAERRPETIAA